MAVTERELRAMIREAIARHTGGGQMVDAVAASAPALPSAGGVHGSHALFALVAVGDDCVIEPSRPCDHCGYCKSLGH